MRFGWKERRKIQRRLKNRVPEALPIDLPRLAICVTAILTIEPRAFAMIARGELNPTLAPIMDKSWAKNELNQAMPKNPVNGLESRLASELAVVLKRMANNQLGEQERLAHTRLVTIQPSEREYLLNLDSLRDSPETRRTNKDALKNFIAQQVQKAGSDHLKENLEVLRKIQAGLNFNLNLNNIFQGHSGVSTNHGTLRYGLLLKDIKPDKTSENFEISSTDQGDYSYAGHADVEWTIGPISEGLNRELYSPAKVDEGSTKLSFMKWLRLPKGIFSGRLKPEIGVLSETKNHSMPNWNVEFAQEEGYYRMIYKMKSSGDRISEEHHFKLPIASDLSIGRRYNDKWQAIETNAYNILLDKNLPIISVHQMHIEDRYRVEASQQIGNHKIALQHRGKPGNPRAVKDGERPESYSIKYETIF